MNTTDHTFLDALTQRGVLISVSIRYWRARKKLNPEDIGLSREQVDDRLFSLGHKRLVPKDCLKSLALIESRAHALVEESTFPFLNGVARYLPNSKLEEVSEKLSALQDEFTLRQGDFLAGYSDMRRTALETWRTAACDLLDQNHERLVAVISDAFPPADVMPRYFSFNIRTFQISVPDIPQATLIDIGTQQELVRARTEAAKTAQREIEDSCREFIAESVATLRGQTAKLCADMLATINGTGSVHQKTLNRLTTFIDQFRQLNFANDTEMERQLTAVKRQFLQRSAGEYRDSDQARAQLVGGLTALRNKASELAGEDAQTLVDNFGRMGTRQFTLAA